MPAVPVADRPFRRIVISVLIALGVHVVLAVGIWQFAEAFGLISMLTPPKPAAASKVNRIVASIDEGAVRVSSFDAAGTSEPAVDADVISPEWASTEISSPPWSPSKVWNPSLRQPLPVASFRP